MPRGKAIKRSTDEQIALLEREIQQTQEKVNRLQDKWKELQKQKREEDLESLLALMKEKDLSIESMKQMIVSASSGSDVQDGIIHIA